MSPAPAPSAVNQSTKLTEDLGCAMNLVQDDESIFARLEKQPRIREPGPIGCGFEVEVERSRRVADDVERERRLAYLARTQQHDGGLTTQGGFNGTARVSFQHSCNFKPFL